MGQRQRLPRLAFSRPFDAGHPTFVARRTRKAAVVAVVALALSFVLLGYIPFFAADRVGAKYGVGAYRAGLERASLVFHVALRMGSIVLPVLLAIIMRRRRGIDVVLVALLGLGLSATLSRGSAFIGPVVFLVAWLVARKWKAWQIVTVVCLTYVSATLVNEVIQVARPAASASFSTRVAASTPEIQEHLGFVNGFETTGGRHIGLRTIFAGLSLNKGEYNPSSYALRIRTGLSDVSDLASGGLRLPAPVWGYASFGWVGVVAWSFVAGLVIGWGTSLTRRLVTPVQGHEGQALNLVLAWVFFQGTFVVLGEFYFPERVELVAFALAAALCWSRTTRHVDEPAPTSVVSARA